MIGQGVLRECLLDPDVERVVALGRSVSGVTHAKLRDLTHKHLFDLSSIEADLTGFDACFDCGLPFHQRFHHRVLPEPFSSAPQQKTFPCNSLAP